MEKVIGIIIQARISSTRLPKKVVKKIEGKTVLEHIIERLQRIKKEKKIILATTDRKDDDVLEKIAKKCRIPVFRGSENDVLDRFYQAAKLFNVDPIVRITADCPLIDPGIAEAVIELYFKNKFDHVCISHPPTFPDGMDVEVCSFKSLQECWRKAKKPEDREHVTTYIFKNHKKFKVGNFSSQENFYDLRLVLDEKEDLVLIKKIYKELYKNNPKFGFKEIIELIKRKPELVKINQKVNSHPISRWQRNQKSL